MGALLLCVFLGRKNKRKAARDVSYFILALLPPMLGNLIIIVSSTESFALVGSYVYFLGLDITVLALLRFTTDYCRMPFKGTLLRRVIYALVIFDFLQFALNPLTGHVFHLTPIDVEGSAYWLLVPAIGQSIHRIIAYGIFFASLGIFGYRTFTSPRFYVERYLIIFISMVVCCVLESFYIFSSTPIDRSMIAFGLFGLLVFYFTLYHKPTHLLNSMLARVVRNMTEGVLLFDRSGSCLYANKSARELFGIQEEADLSGCMALMADLVDEPSLRFDADWSRKRTVEIAGEVKHLEIGLRTIEEKGAVVGAFLSVRDRTEEDNRLARERYMARHDRLTGLYNQDYFYAKVSQLLRRDPEGQYVVAAFDVKDFKIVNDIFSKEFGDKVLVAMADCLRDVAGRQEPTVIGRIGGDKFGLILPRGHYTEAACEKELQRVCDSVSEIGQNRNYSIIIHLGVYYVDGPSLPPSVMYDRAFMALNSVKNDFQHHVAFYDDRMRDDVIRRQRVANELEEAMRSCQIRPYLQPMVDSNGNIQGAEVLARWIHPQEGLLLPGRFIPILESTGLIARFDAYIWECACLLLREWGKRGIDKFLSVNISQRDFYFLDIYEVISGLVRKYGIDPSKLRLEVTESVMMSDMRNRLETMNRLRADGFLMEMDDFGSGYSSLNMLKDVPFDILKIDMMFLSASENAGKARVILQTIINLSTELGITSITEGVETKGQFDMLLDMGCRLFQGYYFARPMAVEDFEEQYLVEESTL